MFHKEGSASHSGGGNSSSGNKKQSKAVDVPLRKSDRRQVRDRAVAFFCRGCHESDNNDDNDELLSSVSIQEACDEIFLKGNLAVRTLPDPRDGHNKAKTMVLYLKTPISSPDGDNDNDGSSTTTCYWPYTTSMQFIWMSLEEKKVPVQETPTVALWAVMYPLLLGNRLLQTHHAIVIPSAASKYLCRGADLMKAGILQVPTSAMVMVEKESAAQALLRQKKKNQNKKNNKASGNDDNDAWKHTVAVMVRGNPQPFAVGMCKIPQSTTSTTTTSATQQRSFGPGTKGMGVEIWNCYGDDLWRSSSSNTVEQKMGTAHVNRHGGGAAPYDNGNYGNVGFVDGQYVLPLVEGEDNDDSDSEHEVEEVGANTTPSNQAPLESDGGPDLENEPNKEIVEEEAVTESDNVDSPDLILHHAFCQALVNLKNKDLPMSTATFYAQHVLSNRPDGTTINLKATSYKKFGNYLKEMMANGLIQVGPDTSNKANTDPMALLVSYNKKHEDLRAFSRSATMDDAGSSAAKKLVMVSLKIVPAHWPNLLRLHPDDVKAVNATSKERQGTGMLTGAEVRKMLDAYIDREELVSHSDPGDVVLDGPLTDIVFGKKNQSAGNPPPESIPRKDLAKVYTNKHLPAYALVEMPGNKIIKLAKGDPPKVQLEVSRRQSNKFVTRVRGLEEYGIDPSYFCKDVKQRLAISATIDADPTSSGHAALPKKGHVELVFGANIVDELEALLSGDPSLSSHGGVKNSEYAVPKQVLNVILKKGVPGRKKQR